MFSIGRIILVGGATLSALAFLGGCKTSGEAPKPAPATPAPAAVRTNHVQLPPDSGDNMAQHILDWDATEKVTRVEAGVQLAPFTFSLTNISAGPVVIYDTGTSCDCTVASLPSKPWAVQAGGTGQIEASIEIRGRTGQITNEIVVFTSRGNRKLKVEAIVPQPGTQ